MFHNRSQFNAVQNTLLKYICSTLLVTFVLYVNFSARTKYFSLHKETEVVLVVDIFLSNYVAVLQMCSYKRRIHEDINFFNALKMKSDGVDVPTVYVLLLTLLKEEKRCMGKRKTYSGPNSVVSFQSFRK